MAADIEKETEAIKTVLNALEPLPPEIRTHVLGYVFTRLNIAVPAAQQVEKSSILTRHTEPSPAAPEKQAERQSQTPTHIKELKEQKKPNSASEMAALVAYYLANLAPQADRKDRVNTKLIETYFTIAEFPLPTKTQFTLPNAKAAGYLDAIGNGEYKLNAVGHNLVVHSMPRGADSKRAARKAIAPKNARRAAKR
jgi:hypothetical protein